MAPNLEPRWCAVAVLLLCWSLILGRYSISAERISRSPLAEARITSGDFQRINMDGNELLILSRNGSGTHTWPELEFGWRVVLGSLIAFAGSALGSVGGVGGGGIFVPMLNLIIGFNLKTSAAISKCMIMGAAGATVYYNIRFRYTTLDIPIIDYDLALLFQPMVILGISIGVTFNVIFAEWMITLILILLFLGTSTKAFIKGVKTWKKESVLLKEAERHLASFTKLKDGPELEYQPLPDEPLAIVQNTSSSSGTALSTYTSSSSGTALSTVPVAENICMKKLVLLLIVWLGFLAIQISKAHAVTCSTEYWLFNALQVPLAAALTLYEAIYLYKGKRTIASTGKQDMHLRIHQLVLYCCFGMIAGIVGGLLGLGGGFILGPLFLEMGVPPQVASATSNFIMTFSSSMSVIQYYLLNRFPIPYSAYLLCVATFAALVGQHVVRKLIILVGRASLIIFVLAFTIFISAIGIGVVGIENVVWKLARKEHMGFDSLCG